VSTPRIAVVIPYFQREPGLLCRALESVVAQEYPASQVVVVDDGSPQTSELEIAGGNFRQRLKGLTVILQSNQGISAARNAGLSNLFQDISAVAFLDSDDQWGPSHLRNAAEALEQGADLYFSNFRHTGLIDNAFRDDPGRRHLMREGQGLVKWTEGVSSLMQSSCPFTTSSVVFRRAIMPDVRFPRKFRRAGEDHVVFWELALHSSCVMYSPKINLTVGNDGIGFWTKATLGTRAHLSRLADEIRLDRLVMKRYPVEGENRRQIRKAIMKRRDLALYSALHLLRRRQNVLGEILYLFWVDPACTVSWCASLPRMVYQWMRD
jgi:succinoglycan biosynthesis protein ExoW